MFDGRWWMIDDGIWMVDGWRMDGGELIVDGGWWMVSIAFPHSIYTFNFPITFIHRISLLHSPI